MTFFQALNQLVELSSQAEAIAKRLEVKSQLVIEQLEHAQRATGHWVDTDTEYGIAFVGESQADESVVL
jgi:NADH:ubiquinone oxidoreductase subunit E